jgi:transcription elongation factor Elf1
VKTETPRVAFAVLLRERMPEPLPCPCCGALFSLDVGRQSSDTFGVRCGACGLTMEKRLSNTNPPGVDTLELARLYALWSALCAWNRRP